MARWDEEVCVGVVTLSAIRVLGVRVRYIHNPSQWIAEIVISNENKGGIDQRTGNHLVVNGAGGAGEEAVIGRSPFSLWGIERVPCDGVEVEVARRSGCRCSCSESGRGADGSYRCGWCSVGVRNEVGDVRTAGETTRDDSRDEKRGRETRQRYGRFRKKRQTFEYGNVRINQSMAQRLPMSQSVRQDYVLRVVTVTPTATFSFLVVLCGNDLDVSSTRDLTATLCELPSEQVIRVVLLNCRVPPNPSVPYHGISIAGSVLCPRSARQPYLNALHGSARDLKAVGPASILDELKRVL
jgi:hypothetical protein